MASELPTSRDLLRLGILLREQSGDDHELSVSKLCEDILPILLGQWSKANALFRYPVIKHEITILRRIKNLWNSASLVARGKGKSSEVRKLEDKLDKLFDVLNCECPIRECQNCGCDGCEAGVHVSCACSKDSKIPVLEVAYIKDQREKVGSKGRRQIGSADVKEHRRQCSAKERKDKKAENEQKRKAKEVEEIEAQTRRKTVGRVSERQQKQ